MSTAFAGSFPRRLTHVVTVRAVRRQLDRWAAITVVPGIQGYGKTTAVAEWLRTQQPPFSWGRLWLTASASRRDVDSGLTELLYEECSDLSLLTRAWPGLALLDAAARSLMPGQRRVLVIDDAHWIRDESYLSELVEVVARHDRLHLVVCTRTPHPIVSIASDRVETVEVRPRDLLLTVDDVRALARSMGIPLQPEEAVDLHESVAGWPAAVRLVLEATLNADRPGTELPLARAEAYLRDVVLPGIEDQMTLAELARLSLADRLTHQLVRDLSEHDDPDDAVRHIEALGLVERRYERGAIVLALPSFVRVALRHFYTGAEHDRAQEMHDRLARWFVAHDGPGHRLHALRHAVAAGDDALIDAIWTRHSAELVLDHTTQLVDVLAVLPADVLAMRPGMSVALEVGQAVRGLDSNRRAEEPASVDRRAVTLRKYADSSSRIAARGLSHFALHDLLDVGTGKLVALRLDGRFSEATAYAKALEGRVALLVAEGGDVGDRLPWFHFQSGLTHTLRAQSAAAMRHYKLTWRMRGQTTRQVAAHAASNLALTHAVLGAAQPANFWLGRLATLGSEALPGSSFADRTSEIARGLLALDRLDEESCEAEIRQLNMDRPFELWAYAACLIAQHGLHYRDAAMTLALLDAAHRGWSHPRPTEPDAATLLLVRARADLMLAAGQGQRALAALTLHDAEHFPVLAVPLARLNLLAGNPLEARRITAELLWTDTVDHRSRQELLLLKAVAAHRMGDMAASGEQTRRALALYEHTRLLRPFTTIERAELESLFADARQSLPADDMRLVSASRSPFPGAITLVTLTPRERLLASALATSASRQQIADGLYVSVNTVRTQLATLYRKLEVGTRQEALARLAALGLLSTPKDHDLHVGPQQAI